MASRARSRRSITALATLSCGLVIGGVGTPVSAASPSAGPSVPVCFALGRTLTAATWSPDGDELVFTTRDRTTTRLEAISFPGMVRRTLGEARDPWFSYVGPTVTSDGRVIVASIRDSEARLSSLDRADPSHVTDHVMPDLDRTWFVNPHVEQDGMLIVSAIDILGSGERLLRVDLTTGQVEPVDLPSELAGRWLRAVSTPADGSFLLLGFHDDSGVRHDWWVLRDGTATPMDFGTDVFSAAVSDDGSRIFFQSNDGMNDSRLVRSVATDGSDPRGEFRRLDVETIAISTQGIAAFAGYAPSFDGAAHLPEPPGSTSSTPTSALCFARTSLAAPDMPHPTDLPPDDPVVDVAFAEVPGNVVARLASLPREVAGGPLHWESGAYTDGVPVPTRVTDGAAFVLASLVATASGADLEWIFVDRATHVSAAGLPSTALLSVVTDGSTCGSTWADLARRELTVRDAGAAVSAAMLSGRDAIVVHDLRDVVLPEEYAQYAEYAAAIRNYLWPESTTYLLPIEDALYIISTDDPELAEATAAALR